MRLLNLGLAFDGATLQIPPVDDLYHWKRITWSAMHFPEVLELDGDRGAGGAFCPWPPAYDWMAGAACRLTGARSAGEVLARAVWFPPLLFALFVALAAVALRRFIGTRAAAAATIAFAASPFLVTASSIGNIDHHFLEPPLTLAILGAVCLGLRARDQKGSLRAGVLLGLSVVAALFVQTALLLAAGLAFIALFLFSDGLSAAIGFGIAALGVSLFRLTRIAGYPDNQWFLGWIHAALFAAAAVAATILWFGRNGRGWAAVRIKAVAILAGGVVALAVPSATAQLLEGLQFLGGDRWLRTILEFQPLWRAHGEDLWSQLAGLSGGALLVWLLAARAWRKRDRVQGTVALFAIAYLLLTISSRRFWIVGIPLLALAGAVYAAGVQRRRLAWLALALIAIPPPLQLAGWMTNPLPPVQPLYRPWVRAARFLRDQPPGRVLAPWSMGHAVDVIGQHPVLIDNFGTMPDARLFLDAHQTLLSTSERKLVADLRRSQIPFLILEEPDAGIRSANAILGTHQDPRMTFWWRLWRGERPRQLECVWREPTLRIYRVLP